MTTPAPVNAPAEGMDTSEAGTSTVAAPVQVQTAKRKNVDELGNEVPDSKRNRAVPDKTVKLNVFKLIIHWHEFLRHGFKIENRYNIDDIADLTSICSTIHTKFRQDTNGVGSLKDRITNDFEFTAAGQVLRYAAIGPMMKQIAATYGFLYQATEDDRKRLGTLSSILVLMVGYRSRFNEVRLGNTSITLKKVDGQEYEMELHRFGMNNTHSGLLHGCRYNPSLQSSMKQAVGPMTIAVNLAMNQDPKYEKSWKDAFCQAFKLIPNVEDIAAVLAKSRTKHNAILKNLADISLFGITRTSNKAFIPVALLLTACEKFSAAYKERFSRSPIALTEIPEDYLPPTIKNMDFSGHGLLHFWNGCSAFDFFMRGDPDVLSSGDASQMLFHAVMGTHKENLNLLRWMTETPFKTRRELGDVFRGRATSGKTVRLHIISYKRFSKMASAAQTDFLRGGVGQVSRQPTFSGKMHTEVNADDELFRIIGTGSLAVSAGARVADDQLLATLHSVKETIKNRLTLDRKISYGTSEFYVPLEGGDGSEYGARVDGPGNVEPRFFYQQD